MFASRIPNIYEIRPFVAGAKSKQNVICFLYFLLLKPSCFPLNTSKFRRREGFEIEGFYMCVFLSWSGHRDNKHTKWLS